MRDTFQVACGACQGLNTESPATPLRLWVCWYNIAFSKCALCANVAMSFIAYSTFNCWKSTDATAVALLRPYHRKPTIPPDTR